MRHIGCSIFKSAVNLKLETQRQMRAFEMQSILFCQLPEPRGKTSLRVRFWVNKLVSLFTTRYCNEMNVRN